MPLLQHLEELRKRLIFCFITLIIFSVFAGNLVPCVLKSLIKPVGELVFINPTEAFWVNLKLSIIIGSYFALPVIFYQLWKFVSMGLSRHEKKNIALLAAASFFLFNTGAGFCYFLVVPWGIKFLLSYSLGLIKPLLSVNNYLSFVTTMLLSFGLIFQLPLIIGFLVRLKILTPDLLKKHRRIVIVLIFIAAAILTPTSDAFTQIALALPLLLLYEISIILSKHIYKNVST